MDKDFKRAAISESILNVTISEQFAKLNIPKDFMNSRCREFERRGNELFEQRRFDKAREQYSLALEEYPKAKDAYFNRGCCYFHLQKLNDAIADFEKVIDLDGKDAESYLKRGLCYAFLGGEDYMKKAIEDYGKAIELKQNSDIAAEAFLRRGNAYRELHEWKNALSDYDTCITISKTKLKTLADAFANRAIVYIHLCDLQAAREDLQRAMMFNADKYAKTE